MRCCHSLQTEKEFSRYDEIMILFDRCRNERTHFCLSVRPGQPDSLLLGLRHEFYPLLQTNHEYISLKKISRFPWTK
jgi:hypothetical protein